MDAFYNFIDPWLGLGSQPKDLTFLQISLRGIIVFLATLAMIRIGHKRSLARKTAFDAVLIVIRRPSCRARLMAARLFSQPLAAAL